MPLSRHAQVQSECLRYRDGTSIFTTHEHISRVAASHTSSCNPSFIQESKKVVG